MSTLPRAHIVDVIGRALADLDVTVLPYARNIDVPPRPTVMVRCDRHEPEPAVGNAGRRVTFALLVISPRTNPGQETENMLEEVLEQLLWAIDHDESVTAKGLRWSEARRATFAELDLPCYQVTATCTVVMTKEETP